MERSSKEDLEKLYIDQIGHFGGVTVGAWRVWRTDIYRQADNKWMGGSLVTHVGDVDLDELAADFTNMASRWHEIGYVLIGGFMSVEEANRHVDNARTKLHALDG